MSNLSTISYIILMGVYIYSVYRISKNFYNYPYSAYFLIIVVSSCLQNLICTQIFWTIVPSSLYIATRNLYVLIEFYCVLFFFLTTFQNKRVKSAIKYVALMYALVICISRMLGDGILTTDYSKFCAIESVTILVFCLCYFIEVLQNEKSSSLITFEPFLLTSSIFLFFGISCPMYVAEEVLQDESQLLKELNNFLYLLFYLLIGLSFRCKRETAIL